MRALVRSNAVTFLLIWVVSCAGAAEESGDAGELTLDRIFTKNEFKEERPPAIHWSKRGEHYFTLDAPAVGKVGNDLVRHDPGTGEKTIVASAAAMTPTGRDKPLVVEGMAFSADESQVLLFANPAKVWRRSTRGDYWVLNVATQELRKLGGDAPASSLMFAKFSDDGTRVAYVRGNNVYVQRLSDLRVTALTGDGSTTLINGTSDWVNEEELGLRDCFRWSPDGTRILFWQFDTKGVKTFTLVNQADGNDQRFTTFPYPTAGERNSAVRLGVVSAEGGAVVWMQTPGDAREHYLPRAEWTPDGRSVLLQQLNRAQNVNRVMRGDPATGAVTTVLTETDRAWVENKNPFRWIGDDGDFLWLSERTGWRHAYRARLDGTLTPVTRGTFDVIDVAKVDAAGGWLYYLASPENATQRYLYRTKLDGGSGPTRVSPESQAGTHAYDVSEGSRWAVHTYSNVSTPPVTEIVSLPEHGVVRVLADNAKVREKLAALEPVTREFLRLDIGSGVELDAWCIRAAAIDETVKHPLLLYVYGEPEGQTVKDAWGGSRTLWHSMLARQGYVVASVDNRGTASPRGRDWRKYTNRLLGVLVAKDQADAVGAMLKRWPFVDPARVGIWGWSGGGSASLDAIFRYPNVYRTAIAVAPVADRRLYDSIYEERYMGQPKDNFIGYFFGSPITHAAALRGHLLIVHGTGDDNVHYRGTEKLANELIARNKPFTLMAYPNRDHTITQGGGTTRHLYELMTRFLRTNLPVEEGTK